MLSIVQQPVMVRKMVVMVVLPVAKEEGTPVVRPDGKRWVWLALPLFPRHPFPLNLLLLLLHYCCCCYCCFCIQMCAFSIVRVTMEWIVPLFLLCPLPVHNPDSKQKET